MNLPFRGLITPLATPLALSPHPEPSLDAPALERLIEHIIAGGVHGIFLLGSTGEFPSLGREMRQEIIRRTCTQVHGRIPVLVNIADTAISETLRLADTAVEAGADAIVLAPPYYFEPSQDDLLRYLEHTKNCLSLPLFLYNIPSLTKSSWEPETVRRAADFPNVVGLKDSTGDLNYLDKTVALLHDRPDFGILIGPEEILLEGMKRGAIGGVCGGSNLNPKLFVALYDAIVRGDWKQAEALQESVQHMNRALYHIGYKGSSYLRGIKAALALAGLCRPEPAPPFAPFSDAEYAQLEEGYRSCAPQS
jgi:dihydrodipicolinate synthase/N-acetylneuraminate lyase